MDVQEPRQQLEDSEPFDPAALSASERRELLTALLFTSAEVVPAEDLAVYFSLDLAGLGVLACETAGELIPRGLDIVRVAAGYKLVTCSRWDEPLSLFHREVRKAKLSQSALEILSIIAYSQPVTRGRIDELRQVSSESTIRTLLDRRLITVAGRADSPGRPFLYRTTDQFLEVFGLASLADLSPRPAELTLPHANLGLVVTEEE
ncbi:SMC-Scp complex subunit ScpB [bacterium]|nr:SMC-Scp complex subunit ScpB [bacterium]